MVIKGRIKMEDAIKALVELFVKEYDGVKKDAAYYHIFLSR